MWFKNAFIYKGDVFSAIKLKPAEICSVVNTALSRLPFTPLTAMQQITAGWVPPFHGSDQLCELVEGRLFMTLMIQEKILPASVINEALIEKMAEIEKQEGRRPSRKEREILKEDIRAEKLPKAFHKSKRVSLFIDLDKQLTVINAGSEKLADEVTAHLREAIGSLPVVPLKRLVSGTHVLTNWYEYPDKRPSMTETCSPVGLAMRLDSSVKSTHRNIDMDAPEIKTGIESGMYVDKLGLNIQGSVTCTIDSNFVLRGIKYGERLVEQASDSDDPRTDALLMSEMLANWLTDMQKVVDVGYDEGDAHLQADLL